MEKHFLDDFIEFTDFFSWAQTNRVRLQAQGSSLEFKLHRLRFISLVEQGYEKQTEALFYARNFEPFAITHTKGKEIFI